MEKIEYFNVVSFIYAIFVFGILYGLLNRFCFKPLFAVMEQRKRLVEDKQAQARSSQQEVRRLIQEQEQTLKNAKREAQSLLNQTVTASRHTAEQILASAKHEAAIVKHDAIEALEAERREAAEKLREDAYEMARTIAAKITEHGKGQ
ncbi:F-type H+-transporting ATPase subunit b [Paenibacillus phyllosphaerae]|uniref:ATP synthase subunit b n=1 Tax=Paenibacillus phyllosphaerae TaxID=274593 RepID=A0A7W5AX52_9BACL|nr:F-type H+-transporting ATPase subunit b [Paenibacillus phyllosphaerae]